MVIKIIFYVLKFYNKIRRFLVLEIIKDDDDAWPFLEPVKAEEAPNYYEYIKVCNLLIYMHTRKIVEFITLANVFKHQTEQGLIKFRNTKMSGICQVLFGKMSGIF